MRSDPAGGRVLPRRYRVVLLAALAALLPVPCSLDAEPAAGGPHLVAAPVAAAATTTSRPSTTRADQPREERQSRTSSLLLPLVLAAILFLAVLGPSSTSHTHRHWH
jgi:hypothetical protein